MSDWDNKSEYKQLMVELEVKKWSTPIDLSLYRFSPWGKKTYSIERGSVTRINKENHQEYVFYLSGIIATKLYLNHAVLQNMFDKD